MVTSGQVPPGSPERDDIPAGGGRTGMRGLFRGAVDHPWWLLTAWTLLLAIAHVPQHGWSWHFIVTGVHGLFSPSPLTLFARHPELQMGPLTFVAAAPFVLLLHGVAGEIAAMALMTGAGLAAVREIRLLSEGSQGSTNARWLITSLVVLAVWPEVAIHWGHLDDVFALLAALVAVRLLRQGRPVVAAIAFALAVDFKPWALPFAVLLFIGPKRRWLLVAAIFTALVSAAWLPFLVGDSHTLAALRFGIHVDAASTLHLIDERAATTPSWDRSAQTAVAIALGLIAVWRRRWSSVLVIVIAARLLLDPGTKNYYDAGLVAATGLLDVVTLAGLVPFFTLSAVVCVYLPSYDFGLDTEFRGVLRTVELLGLLAASLSLPGPETRSGRPRDTALRRTRRHANSPPAV